MFTITRAVPEDAEILAELRGEMQDERDKGTFRVPKPEFFECNLRFFRERLADKSFVSFIAWDGELAVASSGMCIQLHPPTHGNPSGRVGYITNMYTRPAFRRRGVVTMLLERLVETARELKCGRCLLNATDAGHPVYLKYGFTDIPGEMAFDLSSHGNSASR